MKEKQYTVIQKDRSINLLDTLTHLLYHWKWFALSILLFGSYYYYQYAKSTFIYRSDETIIINNSMNTPTTARLSRTHETFSTVRVMSEMLQLKSKELLRQTISRIGADMSYTVKQGLRWNELYREAPIQVTMHNLKPEDSFSLTVTPIGDREILLSNWSKGDRALKIRTFLGRPVQTPIGQITVHKTGYYSKTYLDQEVKVQKYVREAMVDYFNAVISVTQMKEEASLVQIIAEDSNPLRAADLITEMVKVYNEIALRDKNQIGVNTANFIRDRLTIIERELGSVESSIEELRTSNQGIDVSSVGEAYFSDTRQYQAEHTKIETDIRLAQLMRGYLSDVSKKNELIPNNTGLVDVSVETQINEYNATLLRRNRLIEDSSDANPVVQDLDNALDAMRSNISRAVKNTIDGLKIKASNSKKGEYSARGKAMQVPEKQRLMLSVERQQKVKEELYIFLLNKREENAINQAMTEDNIRVIDPASVSINPVAPSRFRKLALGIGIGTILPAIIILIISILDTRVRRREDVESATDAPLLGEIPFVSGKKGEQGDILVNSTGRDALTEAFRILRTNINFMAREGVQPKVITLTSFIPGVGKTFTSLNLSNTLSFLQKKVVVVDLDLRKGTLSKRIGMMNGKGVSHYLSDLDVSVQDIVHKNFHPTGVDYITIGTVAPNPVELLLSKRLDQLINELKELYDYIIVDGVPMGIVADASVVDRISNLTLFVIRAGKMDKRQLPEIQKIYEEKKLNNLAIILNGLKLGQSGYGYGYGYGYSYGYGNNEDRPVIARLFAKIRKFLGR